MNMNKNPNAYHIHLPSLNSYSFAQKHEMHAEMLKDSPCGWCAKKSTTRMIHYMNESGTDVMVLASCDEHLSELRKKIDLVNYSKKPALLKGDDCISYDYWDKYRRERYD